MALGMQERSEIRPSQISDLSARVSRRGFDSYLLGLNLVSLRSYSDAQIRFDFPVTALVGPNGGGKTTVLGAAALIYADVQPRRFFAKSGKYDASMKNWKIEYELVERSLSRTILKRTASYLKAKWNRDAVSRPALVFGVIRTLPASERKEMSRFIAGKFSGNSETELTPEVISAVEKILGKVAKEYRDVAVKSTSVNLFAGKTADGRAYSEFHFGAGEASVIRIVSAIEQSADGTLILIEEIENGLHPVATRRLVEYLIDVAGRKSCQVIFTTHSNDALAPLPDEAVWSCSNGDLTQGKLDVNALRTLTGQVNASLAIFVEDSFGEEMALAALRQYARDHHIDLAGVAIHGVGGHGNAKKFALSHNLNPTIAFPAIAVLDGDMPGEVDHRNSIVSFPGASDPEQHVVESIASVIDEVAAKLCVNLGLPVDQQERVKSAVLARINTNRDPHVIFEQIGEDLDFLSGTTVTRAFLAQWAQRFPDEVEAIFAPVSVVLQSKPTIEPEPVLDRLELDEAPADPISSDSAAEVSP
jgi:predicted ATPase